MTLLVINISSVVCAIIMAVAAIELWRLTRSSGLMVVAIACIYLTAVRLLIAEAETFSYATGVLDYRSLLIAPFWPLMAIGFLLLLSSLRKFYRDGADRRVKQVKYEGIDRRKA